jgi:glutaredoxin
VSTSVVLYGRDGCCLCEEARQVLLAAQARHAFRLDERDIERDERLLRTYLERIPVVEINGVERFQFFVDPEELERLLQDSRPAPTPR